MERIVNLTPDYLNAIDTLEAKIVREKLSGGPKGTRIIMRNADTGEELGEYHNKVTITGGIKSACDAFGIKSPVILPNYNKELGLENTLEGVDPKNNPIICLFCVGDSGCGLEANDIFVAKYVDRISPVDDIIPFRYQNITDDLSDDLRKYYFGRKVIDDKVAYYFKTFDTTPQMHLRYTDGTQINNQLYNIETTQAAECYVETRLKVSRSDCRDYFEQVLGWDKARISTLSLCYAWYDDTIDKYKWYQDIYPYSKLNFTVQRLVDLTMSLEFVYQVFY